MHKFMPCAYYVFNWETFHGNGAIYPRGHKKTKDWKLEPFKENDYRRISLRSFTVKTSEPLVEDPTYFAEVSVGIRIRKN